MEIAQFLCEICLCHFSGVSTKMIQQSHFAQNGCSLCSVSQVCGLFQSHVRVLNLNLSKFKSFY